MKHIVSLKSDTNVIQITMLAPRWHAAVTHGGFGQAIDPMILTSEKENDAKRQIELAVETAGQNPDEAARFVRALVVGGENEEGARDLIRQRHLSEHRDWTAVEYSELPRPWFFRNAWRLRDGKVYVDMTEARKIFTDRLIEEKGVWMRKLPDLIEQAFMREEDDTTLVDHFGKLKNLDLHAMRDKTMKANTTEQLIGLWPNWLPTEYQLT